jgi:hypothetical protein
MILFFCSQLRLGKRPKVTFQSVISDYSGYLSTGIFSQMAKLAKISQKHVDIEHASTNLE